MDTKSCLKEYGYPRIRTLDQYFEIIEDYAKKYPRIDGNKTIGFEILSYDWHTFCLTNPPSYLAGYPNDGIVMVNPKTQKAQIYADKEISKKYYKKLNEINQKGLLDRDTFTQNYEQYLHKISSGAVLGMYDQNWQFNKAEAALRLEGKIERTYMPLPITYDESIKDYYKDRPPLNLNRGFSLSIDCQDPVRVMKMFDGLITERWQKILRWGIEGEDYSVNKNGEFYLTPEQGKKFASDDWKRANRADLLLDSSPKMEGFLVMEMLVPREINQKFI